MPRKKRSHETKQTKYIEHSNEVGARHLENIWTQTSRHIYMCVGSMCILFGQRASDDSRRIYVVIYILQYVSVALAVSLSSWHNFFPWNCRAKDENALEVDFGAMDFSMPHLTLSSSIGNGLHFVSKFLTSNLNGGSGSQGAQPLVDYLLSLNHHGEVWEQLFFFFLPNSQSVLSKSFELIHLELKSKHIGKRKYIYGRENLTVWHLLQFSMLRLEVKPVKLIRTLG